MGEKMKVVITGEFITNMLLIDGGLCCLRVVVVSVR